MATPKTKCSSCVTAGVPRPKRTAHASGLCADHRNDAAAQKQTGRVPLIANPTVRDRLLQALQAGNSIDASVDFAGMDRVTFYRYRARGRPHWEATVAAASDGLDLPEVPAEDQPYFEFYRSVEQARNSSEVRRVLTIEQAAPDHWQAAAWLLERTNPERWGRKTRIEHAGDPDHPIDVNARVDGEALPHKQTVVEDDDRTAAVLAVLVESLLLPEEVAVALVDDGLEDELVAAVAT